VGADTRALSHLGTLDKKELSDEHTTEAAARISALHSPEDALQGRPGRAART